MKLNMSSSLMEVDLLYPFLPLFLLQGTSRGKRIGILAFFLDCITRRWGTGDIPSLRSPTLQRKI